MLAGGDGLSGGRSSEQKALGFVAAGAQDGFELLLGFDALGDHSHIQAVGEGDDGFDESGGRRFDADLTDEGSINFQGVDRHTVEVAEG